MPASSTSRRSSSFRSRKWNAILSINLSSAFHTTRLALPAMRQNKFGRITHRVRARIGRIALQGGLCRGQAWPRRLTKVTALENRRGRHYLQRDLPGLRHTPLVEAQIDSQAKAPRHSTLESHPRGCSAQQH